MQILTSLGLLTAGLMFTSSRIATAAESVTFTQTGSTTWVGRVNEPDVKVSSKGYPQITFEPGDVVLVRAGGCAQTGGVGDTWKRYVDPSGPNAGHLYHGLISIPGATAGLVRIQSVIGQPLTVPAHAGSAPLILRLGYEDDGYGDNGYWGHDDGTGDQCKNVGNAWVTVDITRNGTAPVNSPFDLVWTDVDPNGLPLNPQWQVQADGTDHVPSPASYCGSGFQPPCTSQTVDIDTPTGFNAVLCGTEQAMIHGHVNWGSGTYVGPVFWFDHSDWTHKGDDDYDMRLQSVDGRGVTKANDPGLLELEYDSDETIDHFTSDWWNGFHQAVDRSNSDAGALVDGREAVVCGVVNLDCEHDCHTELHPVYAMAIHVKDDPADDQWAVFVRNWGNEGFCSSLDHLLYLPDNVFFFRLPWRAGASTVMMSTGQFRTSSSAVWGPGVSGVNAGADQGAYVSFGLANWS